MYVGDEQADCQLGRRGNDKRIIPTLPRFIAGRAGGVSHLARLAGGEIKNHEFAHAIHGGG